MIHYNDPRPTQEGNASNRSILRTRAVASRIFNELQDFERQLVKDRFEYSITANHATGHHDVVLRRNWQIKALNLRSYRTWSGAFMMTARIEAQIKELGNMRKEIEDAEALFRINYLMEKFDCQFVVTRRIDKFLPGGGFEVPPIEIVVYHNDSFLITLSLYEVLVFKDMDRFMEKMYNLEGIPIDYEMNDIRITELAALQADPGARLNRLIFSILTEANERR